MKIFNNGSCDIAISNKVFNFIMKNANKIRKGSLRNACVPIHDVNSIILEDGSDRVIIKKSFYFVFARDVLKHVIESINY